MSPKDWQVLRIWILGLIIYGPLSLSPRVSANCSLGTMLELGGGGRYPKCKRVQIRREGYTLMTTLWIQRVRYKKVIPKFHLPNMLF